MKSSFVIAVVFVGLSLLLKAGPSPGQPIDGIELLPSPKRIETVGLKFLLNENRKAVATIIVAGGDTKHALVAREINSRIEALGGQALPVCTEMRTAFAGPQGPNTIILRYSNEILARPAGHDETDAGGLLAAAGGEQGYAIYFGKRKGEGRRAVITGAGWQGLLHGSNTFRLLIRREGTEIFATEAEIADWPDFQNRGVPVWPLPGSFAEFKRFVDWAFHYKFNRIYTNATRVNEADGFNLPTREERAYLKRINRYAKERGILINYALNWAVEKAARGNVQNQGTVTFGGQQYTWGNDTLLRKRAMEIARFVRETEAGSLHLHCIDTYNEDWENRSAEDRARFKDDRAAADANVINIFTGEIRRSNPGIELQFVVYPYHANLDLKGNEQHKAWMKKLTASIPKDVYLVVVELNRDQTESWVRTVKQPLVHWVNGNAFQWGRYFSTLPAFTKSAYFEDRNQDIIVHMEPIGYFNGEIVQLVAAEYGWNVNAPGSGCIVEDAADKNRAAKAGDLRYRQETFTGKDINTFGWYDGTTEPQYTARALLLRACRLEFGDKAAPFMVEFFQNNPVGRRNPVLFGSVLREVMAGKELEASRDQLQKAEKALIALKMAFSVVPPDSPTKKRLKSFLTNTYQQSLVIAGTLAALDAKYVSAHGSSPAVSGALRDGRSRLLEIRDEMKKAGLWSTESSAWFEAGNRRIEIVEVGMTRKGLSRNLIVNAGFESSPRSRVSSEPIQGWSSAGNIILTQESHRGRYAARVVLKPSDQFVLLEQAIQTGRATSCYVEFWLKKDGDFRVIPMMQYRNKNHSERTEVESVEFFPFDTAIRDYTLYDGTIRVPPDADAAVFKIYADWHGFMPTAEKHFDVDDVLVDCYSLDAR